MTTILLIEDDPLLGAMIREMLEDKRYSVTWVRSGVPVRRLITQDPPPDLILTDIIMPDMDGLETIQYIRATRPEIPLIAMSAQTNAGYLTLAARMGAMAVLEKPFTQERLYDAIAEVMGRGERLMGSS
jgi:two-component system response regulator PfeR